MTLMMSRSLSGGAYIHTHDVYYKRILHYTQCRYIVYCYEQQRRRLRALTILESVRRRVMWGGDSGVPEAPVGIGSSAASEYGGEWDTCLL